MPTLILTAPPKQLVAPQFWTQATFHELPEGYLVNQILEPGQTANFPSLAFNLAELLGEPQS